MDAILKPGTLCWLRVLTNTREIDWLCFNEGRVVEVVRYRGIEDFIGGARYAAYDLRSKSRMHGIIPVHGGKYSKVTVLPGQYLRAPRPALIPFADPADRTSIPMILSIERPTVSG